MNNCVECGNTLGDIYAVACGDKYCFKCFNQEFYICQECEERFYKGEKPIDFEGIVCPECIELYYAKCPECQQYWLKEEIGLSGVCPEC